MTSQPDKSKLNRRAFLRWTGAGLVAVVGGSVWRAADQGVFSVGQGAAYEPWTDWFALMPFRLGYATGAARPSPRRAVNEVIRLA